ncbi:hypothetical protein NPIL_607221 [Nephila pilipes]|uniref:Uncharacterized protein n=1 Tax=Nephila pilipes TaxID=299642 RepID=A0A8X6KMN1_NEPPI|nr:hypothetical protein NPIL_607221 [Nephila pilipes]
MVSDNGHDYYRPTAKGTNNTPKQIVLENRGTSNRKRFLSSSIHLSIPQSRHTRNEKEPKKKRNTQDKRSIGTQNEK